VEEPGSHSGHLEKAELDDNHLPSAAGCSQLVSNRRHIAVGAADYANHKRVAGLPDRSHTAGAGPPDNPEDGLAVPGIVHCETHLHKHHALVPDFPGRGADIVAGQRSYRIGRSVLQIVSDVHPGQVTSSDLRCSIQVAHWAGVSAAAVVGRHGRPVDWYQAAARLGDKLLIVLDLLPHIQDLKDKGKLRGDPAMMYQIDYKLDVRLLEGGGEAQFHDMMALGDPPLVVSGWRSKAHRRHLANMLSSNAYDDAQVNANAVLYMARSLADSRQDVSGDVAYQGAVVMLACLNMV
jgi:hypothetical protein